ncbi:Rib/alpha-like domain-containing protein, partial [Rothia nasimurium]
PGTDVTPGKYPVEVTVTYPDGSTDTVTTEVTVNEAPVDPVTPVADNNSPSYSSITVDPGTSTTIGSPTNPDGSALPDGSTFTGGEGNPSWVTVNPDGSITVTPGTDVT